MSSTSTFFYVCEKRSEERDGIRNYSKDMSSLLSVYSKVIGVSRFDCWCWINRYQSTLSDDWHKLIVVNFMNVLSSSKTPDGWARGWYYSKTRNVWTIGQMTQKERKKHQIKSRWWYLLEGVGSPAGFESHINILFIFRIFARKIFAFISKIFAEIRLGHVFAARIFVNQQFQKDSLEKVLAVK